MSFIRAIVATSKSKRFWLWEIAGAVLYGVPAIVRFVTGTAVIPILNFPGRWVWHIVPGNFLEKLLINAFFPGGAGGVAGEIFISNYEGKAVKGKTKYLSRLAGALAQTIVWSTFQYIGYSFLITMPYEETYLNTYLSSQSTQS